MANINNFYKYAILNICSLNRGQWLRVVHETTYDLGLTALTTEPESGQLCTGFLVHRYVYTADFNAVMVSCFT